MRFSNDAGRCLALIAFCLAADATPAGMPIASGLASAAALETGIDPDRFARLQEEARRGRFDRACTPAEHDSTRWHPLVNETAGCHFDHQHGDDPEFAADLFGTPGAWFGNPGQ